MVVRRTTCLTFLVLPDGKFGFPKDVVPMFLILLLFSFEKVGCPPNNQPDYFRLSVVTDDRITVKIKASAVNTVYMVVYFIPRACIQTRGLLRAVNMRFFAPITLLSVPQHSCLKKKF